jgi:lysophospholipase L1-like esterase
MLRGWVVEAAKRNGVRVAFCGSALNAVFDDKGGDEAANKYVGSRNIHAHPRGLYIATCAMYAALTGRSPVGLPAPTPKKKPDTRPGKQDPNYTEEELRYLQTIAWETQKKYAKTLPAPGKTLVENQARPVLKTEKKDVPAAYSDPEYFESAIEMFEADDKKNPQPEGAVVCVGSSSIVGWHNTIQKDLAPLKIIPRGFGGSTMNCAFHYVDRVVIKYKPRAVLLYEGDNDIDGGVEPEYFVKTFKKFAAKIHKALPETRIFALSIKPSPSRWDRWPDMKKANELLKAECGRNPLLTYIDIATPMLGRDGTPKREIFTDDELHMNRKGYELWTRTIKPVLFKALPAKR